MNKTILKDQIDLLPGNRGITVIAETESEYGFDWVYKDSMHWIGKSYVPSIDITLDFVSSGENKSCTCIYSGLNFNVTIDYIRFYAKIYKLVADFLNGIAEEGVDELTWEDMYTDNYNSISKNIDSSTSSLDIKTGDIVIKFILIRKDSR